jgi:hypothetical protein
MRSKPVRTPIDRAEKGRARAHDHHMARALEKALKRKAAAEAHLRALGMMTDKSIDDLTRG